jgi:hypothetical protein
VLWNAVRERVTGADHSIAAAAAVAPRRARVAAFWGTAGDPVVAGIMIPSVARVKNPAAISFFLDMEFS